MTSFPIKIRTNYLKCSQTKCYAKLLSAIQNMYHSLCANAFFKPFNHRNTSWKNTLEVSSQPASLSEIVNSTLAAIALPGYVLETPKDRDPTESVGKWVPLEPIQYPSGEKVFPSF